MAEQTVTLSLPVAEHPHWKRTARLAAALNRVGVEVRATEEGGHPGRDAR